MNSVIVAKTTKSQCLFCLRLYDKAQQPHRTITAQRTIQSITYSLLIDGITDRFKKEREGFRPPSLSNLRHPKR